MIDRYFTEEMKNLCSEKNYYRKWLEVEAAVLKARGRNKLASAVLEQEIEPEEIRKKEEISGHELNAFLSILQERIGPEAASIHSGLTSSDVMDTARILQVKDSIELTENKLKLVKEALKEKALQHKDLIMCGRTHGQIAEPLTMGLKIARWYSFACRNLERIEEYSKRILVGKISGAVGSYSLVTPEEEKKSLAFLGLNAAPVASQVIARDIFAEYLFLMATISSMAGEISTEIRLLTQDFIKEASEPFSSTQTGSSAMPHKKNPILCERMSGLARLTASYVQTGFSNITLWNERDISHSSNERIMLQDSSSLCCYILDKLLFVLKNLTVHEENIKNNLERAGARLYSSAVLKLLLDKKTEREKAYRLSQKIFMQEKTKNEIKEILVKETSVTPEEAAEALDPRNYLKNIDEIYRRLGIL
ncbi:MAG: adenylosuccinate lyase [Elusimicrobiota bacterium]